MLGPLLTKYSTKFHFEYIVCNCNSRVAKQFIGMWRPFLRQLLQIYSEKQGQSKEYIVNSHIRCSNVDDKVEIIEQIFNLKNLARNKSQTSLNTRKSAVSSKVNLISPQ